MRVHHLVFAATLALSATPAYSSDIDPRAAARDAANAARLTPGSSIFGNSRVEDVVAPFEGTNIPETSITGSNIEDRRNQAVAGGGTSSQALQTLSDSNNLRPTREISHDNPALGVADYVITNKYAIAGHLFSATVDENPQCNMEDFSALEPFERFCESHTNLTERVCQIDRVVEVDRIDTWQCDITADWVTVRCTPDGTGSCPMSQLPEGNPQNQCVFQEERRCEPTMTTIREPSTGSRLNFNNRMFVSNSLREVRRITWDGRILFTTFPGDRFNGSMTIGGWTYHLDPSRRATNLSCTRLFCDRGIYRTRNVVSGCNPPVYDRDYICPTATQCDSLEAQPSCTVISDNCLSSNRGTCVHQRKTFECLNDLSDHAPAALLNSRIERIEDQLVNSCDPDPASEGCIAGDMKCSIGRQVRTIMGFPISRDCWQYEQSFTCLGDEADTQSDCGPFENDPSCEIIGQHCLSFDEAEEQTGPTPAACQHWEYQYRCGGDLGLPEQCTATNVCVGELCEGIEDEANKDFAMATAWLTMLDEAVNDNSKSIDAQNIELFAGQRMHCSRRALSYGDCCRDSGWGLNLFMQCSEQEFALMDRKSAKSTHYVGSYCTRKFLGVCITRRRVYCGFNSQMGKVFQSQIRRQTGLSWGSARNPDCSGLSLDQIEEIDWEAIDLSEAFAGMMNSATVPSASNVMNQLQRNLNLSSGQISPGD